MRLVAIITIWLLACAPAGAVDLCKIDRTIAAEPRYQFKPQYCLLVFGPQATKRVWLVRDGDVLYVDRNGNGDLTEPSKRFAIPQLPPSSPAGAPREVNAGDIRDGALKHTQLRILMGIEENKPVYNVSIAVEVRPQPGDKLQISGRITQSAYCDHQGQLRFADRPQDAPIIHFGGKMQMGLLRKDLVPNKDTDPELQTLIGTPGLGAGTFAAISYAGWIEADIHPLAEFTFPPKTPGDDPVRVSAVLSHRC